MSSATSRAMAQTSRSLWFRHRECASLSSRPLGLHQLKKKDRQAGIETLYGSKVLLQQHDVAVTSQPAERDYSSAMVRFYYEYGRWPTRQEAIDFDKTIPVEPLVKKVQ